MPLHALQSALFFPFGTTSRLTCISRARSRPTRPPVSGHSLAPAARSRPMRGHWSRPFCGPSLASPVTRLEHCCIWWLSFGLTNMCCYSVPPRGAHIPSCPWSLKPFTITMRVHMHNPPACTVAAGLKPADPSSLIGTQSCWLCPLCPPRSSCDQLCASHHHYVHHITTVCMVGNHIIAACMAGNSYACPMCSIVCAMRSNACSTCSILCPLGCVVMHSGRFKVQNLRAAWRGINGT